MVCGLGIPGSIHLGHEPQDFLVARIRIQDSTEPFPGPGRIPGETRNVPQVTKGNQVFRVERDGRTEGGVRLVDPAHLKQRLTVDHVPVHVRRLLREVTLADADGHVEVPRLAEFVRQRRKKASRVLVVPLLEFS